MKIILGLATIVFGRSRVSRQKRFGFVIVLTDNETAGSGCSRSGRCSRSHLSLTEKLKTLVKVEGAGSNCERQLQK